MGGIYADSDRDLLADRTTAYLALTGGGGSGVVDLASRIGLEGTGIRLPLAYPVGAADPVPERGLPILWGTDPGPAAPLLREDRVLLAEEEAGSGWMEYVPRAFGEKDAVVMGGDEEGLEAITRWAAGTLPALWEPGPGTFRLEDVEDEVRRFFQARGGAGQAALALSKLGDWLDRLEDTEIEDLEVELAVEEVPEGLGPLVRRMLAERFPRAEGRVELHATGFGSEMLIFEQDLEIPWEVEDARRRLHEEVLPRLGPGSSGSIRMRLSESPEIRSRLAGEVRDLLAAAGADTNRFEVEVLSAYKQGYSWLVDRLLPRLKPLPVERIEISYHTLKDSDEIRWQTIAADTRWLQEIYPADAVLARGLGISDSVITFRPTLRGDPIYTLTAFDAEGGMVLEESFTPEYVVRPFFDLFPEYEQVRVTTGWIRAEVDGRILLDERVVTDPERFWEILQTDTYLRIAEYVMDIQEGDPSPSNAPFFDRFEVDLTLSEPDFRVGVDEEVVSSAEALHEDIYFETLTLFDLIGARYQTGGLDYPGRVLPWIHVDREGGGARARITFTGKERAEPSLRLTFTAEGAEPERWSYELSPLRLEDPVLRGASIRSGDEGLRTLLFEVTASDSLDRWEEYRFRGSEETIDRTFLSVERLSDMVERLRGLHRAGLYQEELGLDRVASLLFRFTLEDSLDFARTAGLPRPDRPRTTRRPVLEPEDRDWEGERIVGWKEPIGLEENREILRRLSAFEGVRTYYAGSSFLGNDIFAADFTVPYRASMVSRPKLVATKPVLFLSGRQHANEVSSTSHLLRLGELLVTDPAYGKLLERVNVVIHPITNPDGVTVAMAMQEENPDFMLHAGYLGALGVDPTAGSSSADPLYPESRVRPLLQRMWLPDVYLNLHGYPSHEWVQYFAGYSAWVRNRRGGQRSWWAPRGWFIPGFSWVDDEDHPEIKEAQFALLDSIASAVTGQPEVENMNQRLYQRYRKYGKQDTEGFREHFHEGMLVYLSLTGREVRGSGPSNPAIQWFRATTEAPDETARGEWLQLVCTAGLAHTSAVLRYLAEGPARVQREAEESAGRVDRRVFRKRPVLPPRP
ncbi:MAG: M14 family metallopeptidase [bacterium]